MRIKAHMDVVRGSVRSRFTRAGSMRQGSFAGALMVLAVVVSVGHVGADEPSFFVSGYYKNFSVVYDPPYIEDVPASIYPDYTMGSVSNRLRLNGHLDAGHVSFELAYDVAPRIQDPTLFTHSLFVGGSNPSQYRFNDLKTRPYPDEDELESFAIYQNLDRALVEIRTKPVDFVLGRQPIAWGSSRSISPTDIVAPFRFEELDTEDRVGVDAVRARVPIGFMGEADIGYVFGEDFEFNNSAFFARGKYYVLKTDVSLLGLGFQENLMVGLDLARSIGGASTWLEASYVFIDAFDDRDTRSTEDYLRATAGADYIFRDGTYVFAEYHYSGIGSDEPNDYLDSFLRREVLEGSVYLMGKHYFAPGITYSITPLITFTGQALANLTDPSLLLTPQIEYNIAENVYLSGGAFVGIGDSPTMAEEGPNLLAFESEFGAYPNMFFGAFRVYF